jgi:hypothetical protein
VRLAAVNPLEHYVRFGAAEGRDPHPLFDTAWYLAHNPDARIVGITPLEHYVRCGADRGGSPHPLFDINVSVAGRARLFSSRARCDHAVEVDSVL